MHWGGIGAASKRILDLLYLLPKSRSGEVLMSRTTWWCWIIMADVVISSGRRWERIRVEWCNTCLRYMVVRGDVWSQARISEHDPRPGWDCLEYWWLQCQMSDQIHIQQDHFLISIKYAWNQTSIDLHTRTWRRTHTSTHEMSVVRSYPITPPSLLSVHGW